VNNPHNNNVGGYSQKEQKQAKSLMKKAKRKIPDNVK
jgi:hypothetical protein